MDAMLDALISLLVIICPFKEKANPDDNIIIDYFLKEQNIYNEKLLYLANKGSLFRLDAIMHTIDCMLHNSKTKDFFNVNDLDIVVTAGLRELETPNAVNARVMTMKTLSTIIEIEEYRQGYSHRLKDY